MRGRGSEFLAEGQSEGQKAPGGQNWPGREGQRQILPLLRAMVPGRPWRPWREPPGAAQRGSESQVSASGFELWTDLPGSVSAAEASLSPSFSRSASSHSKGTPSSYPGSSLGRLPPVPWATKRWDKHIAFNKALHVSII